MSTFPITNYTAAQSTDAQRQDAGSELGTNAFMKLLISELKNQDPLDPMQSRDMIAQLAQLSSVEKLDSINTAINALDAGITAISNRESVGLIGKTVSADGSNLNLDSVGSVSTYYNLNGNAAAVKAVVRDSSGNIVRSLNFGQTQAGSYRFVWDGINDAGTRAPAGRYYLGLSATDQSGNPVVSSLQINGQVERIVYQNGSAELIVNGAQIDLRDVISVSQ